MRAPARNSVPEPASSRSGAAAARASSPICVPLSRANVSRSRSGRGESLTAVSRAASPRLFSRRLPSRPTPNPYQDAKSHQDVRAPQAAPQGGDRARERWFGGAQAAPSESGLGAAAGGRAASPQGERSPARRAHAASRWPRRDDRRQVVRVEETGSHEPEPDRGRLGRLSAAAVARPADSIRAEVCDGAPSSPSPQAEASEAPVPARPAQSGPLEINAVEVPPSGYWRRAYSGSFTCSRACAFRLGVATPATIGQSEIVAARTSTMVTSRQEMAARQEVGCTAGCAFL